MTSFQLEPVDGVWDEALPLVSRNHAESGAMPAEDFDPSREAYSNLERLGILKAFTSRDQASVLIGYAVFIISPGHLHYPRVCWAMQDVLYVDPASRGPMTFRFMKWQDERLRDHGVHAVYRHNTMHKDYSRMLLHMGYHPEEMRYVKDLRG